MAANSAFRSLAIPTVFDYLRKSFIGTGITMAKIVTANTLATGHVVFLAADGGWVDTIATAVTYDDAAAAEGGLAQAHRAVAEGLVIDPFVTETGPDRDGRPAMTLRDTIRAYGPTIRYRSGEAGQG